MSEAVRSGWGAAVALVLAEHERELAGEVLDLGGGAARFARSLPGATLVPVGAAESPGAPDLAPEVLDALTGRAFDAAVCVGRLAFAAEPAHAIARAADALKPGAPLLAIVPCGFAEELSAALHAFTLRGLHSMLGMAGLEVEFARGVNPAGGGALSRELAAFTHQSPRPLNLPDEITGWVDVMDERRPMLLACLGRKPQVADR